jgi:hypothetical protein
MMENLSDMVSRMSPRAKAISKIAGVALGGMLLVGGCNLVVSTSPGISQLMIERNPSAYISGVSDYLDGHQEEAAQYMADVSGLAQSVNSLPSLPEADRLYLFESNASNVDVAKGIGVCDSKVIGRADEAMRLEHVLNSIDGTDNKYYLQIVGRVVKDVGEDAYNSLAEIFKR